MKTNTNDGGPAFPRPCGEFSKLGPGGGEYNTSEKGMSLRDWFAGMALQGNLARMSDENFSETYAKHGGSDDKVCAALARGSYKVADAMLKAREESQ